LYDESKTPVKGSFASLVMKPLFEKGRNETMLYPVEVSLGLVRVGSELANVGDSAQRDEVTAQLCHLVLDELVKVRFFKFLA